MKPHELADQATFARHAGVELPSAIVIDGVPMSWDSTHQRYLLNDPSLAGLISDTYVWHDLNVLIDDTKTAWYK